MTINHNNFHLEAWRVIFFFDQKFEGCELNIVPFITTANWSVILNYFFKVMALPHF